MKANEGPCVLGVDPGLTGALAVISYDHRILMALDMPTVTEAKGRHKSVSIKRSALRLKLSLLRSVYDIRYVAMEDVRSSPQMGVTSAFSFGMGFGVLLDAIETICDPTPLFLIRPTEWKQRLGLAGAVDKKYQSIAKARRVFAEDGHHFLARMKDHGRAEAALIAHYLLDYKLKDLKPLMEKK